MYICFNHFKTLYVRWWKIYSFFTWITTSYLLKKIIFHYDLKTENFDRLRKRKFSEGPISWEMACQCERQRCDAAESMLFTAWSLLISRLRLMPRDAFERWRGTIAQGLCVWCGYWPVNNFIKWQNRSKCFLFLFFFILLFLMTWSKLTLSKTIFSWIRGNEAEFLFFSVLGRIFFWVEFFPICYWWNLQSKLSWQNDKGYSPITNYMFLYSNCVWQPCML